jgi:hypothetical protein
MDYEGNEMAGAIFSPDRAYRYALWRQWSPETPARTISWVLLNPSTADAVQLDATLTRCRSHSRRWKFDRMNVLNLYAFRDRNPDVMRRQVDPIGPDNVAAIRQYVNESELCIAAWGEKVMHPGRLDWLRELVAPVPIHVLGYTKTGEPRHPLYMRGDCGHRAAFDKGGPVLQKGQKATIDVNKAERDAIDQVLKSPRHNLDNYERDLLKQLLDRIDKAAPPSSGANPAGGSSPPSTP